MAKTIKKLPLDPLDPQRDRLYAAEKAVFDEKATLPLEDLREFARGIQASGWWQRSFPGKRVPPVKDGRGDSYARRNDGALHMPRKTRRLDVLVHELGHAVAPAGEWHGAGFAGTVLWLYGLTLGADIKRRVMREFRRKDVIWDRRLCRYGP